MRREREVVESPFLFSEIFIPRGATVQSPDSKILTTEFPNIVITTATDTTANFRPILEQGFWIQIEDSGTVQDVLCRQLGVAEDYLRDRVQTVFLNGKAVDDENTAVVNDGDRLALSASMPGLVGATMRKGGFFSGLRANISHQKPAEAAASKSEAVITIKLFNMIASEIGALFLARGIGIRGRQLVELWDRVGDQFWQQVHAAAINGRPCELMQLKSADWGDGMIRLKLQVD
jgi:hypothetical protein